jgi:hypothetical protein
VSTAALAKCLNKHHSHLDAIAGFLAGSEVLQLSWPTATYNKRYRLSLKFIPQFSLSGAAGIISDLIGMYLMMGALRRAESDQPDYKPLCDDSVLLAPQDDRNR